MLVTLNEILAIAEEKKIAIGAFNTPNLENLMAVLSSAEKHKLPVIIAHAEVHEDIMPLSVIGPIMLQMAKDASIPVCVHLDHGETLEYIERALKLGFTSIMYDGSLLPYEDNVKNTRMAVAIAIKYGASIEAEIGILAGREAGSEQNGLSIAEMYTDPVIAKEFVKDTGIDALAASFGTAHGFYKTKPQLDFDRIKRIKALVSIPLVMHGGSGVSPQDYETAIHLGIRKINYYSYMARAGVDAVKNILKNSDVQFFHELSMAAVESMKADVEKALKVFGMNHV